jgi:hypothetical protein
MDWIRHYPSGSTKRRRVSLLQGEEEEPVGACGLECRMCSTKKDKQMACKLLGRNNAGKIISEVADTVIHELFRFENVEFFLAGDLNLTCVLMDTQKFQSHFTLME